jgi:pimeloyl-ACP methyl ester carboxylesterase
MPYANNNGVRIYYEVEGQGPPLVMLHGGGGELSAWRQYGYSEALKNDYRLILIDERGHGKSDKPHDAESYDVPLRVGDVTAVMDDLGVDKAHFLGYSYGGRIALDCANTVPQRVLSLIVGGMGPQGTSHDGSNPALKLFEAGPEAIIAMREASGPLPAEEKARILGADFKAQIALVKSPWPNLEADLQRMTMPVLIFIGELDSLWPPPVVNKAYSILPDAEFVVLPGLDHGQAGRRIDLVLPPIKEFLAGVSKK